MRILLLLTFTYFFSSALYANTNTSSADLHTRLYQEITWTESKPQFQVFDLALKGYFKLLEQHQISDSNQVLTIIDFSLPSDQERMWIVDMNSKQVIESSLVAHGRNSGEKFAEKFSNRPESYQSSIGFYKTGEVYYGKHGMSLRLDGLEAGWNDNARKRAIVLHGADYVSRKFIKENGRLGRSLGCPAVPNEKTENIIKIIKENTCMFIYYPSNSYLNGSKLLGNEMDS